MRALRSPWMTGFLAVGTAWLVVLAIGATIGQHRVSGEFNALEGRIRATREENIRLTADLERMRQPERLMLLARQRLQYKLPDEQVVIVYKSEKADTISQSVEPMRERSSWRKWLDWLLGG